MSSRRGQALKPLWFRNYFWFLQQLHWYDSNHILGPGGPQTFTITDECPMWRECDSYPLPLALYKHKAKHDEEGVAFFLLRWICPGHLPCLREFSGYWHLKTNNTACLCARSSQPHSSEGGGTLHLSQDDLKDTVSSRTDVYPCSCLSHRMWRISHHSYYCCGLQHLSTDDPFWTASSHSHHLIDIRMTSPPN